MLLIDFSASGYLAARLENLETYVDREFFGEGPLRPAQAETRARPRPVTDVVALRASTTGLRPRHRARHLRALPRAGQRSAAPPRDRADAVQPALHAGHEPELEACEKRWVVNRIVDPQQEAAIIALLEERGQHYLHSPSTSANTGASAGTSTGSPTRGSSCGALREDERPTTRAVRRPISGGSRTTTSSTTTARATPHCATARRARNGCCLGMGTAF
jgi:hypothetical protein